MKARKWMITGVAGVVVCAAVLLLLSRSTDDGELAARLVGNWQAVDPGNDALHRQKDAVSAELISIQTGGALMYTVAMSASPDTPRIEPWGWTVKKGRLLLQFRGDGAVQDDWMPPVKFTVSGNKLSILRRGFPAKDFTRVNS